MNNFCDLSSFDSFTTAEFALKTSLLREKNQQALSPFKLI